MRKPWPKRIALLAALGAGIGAAVRYTPPEERTYRSPYLSTLRSRFVDTASFRIHYVNQGQGEPLVLLPGGGTWLYSFRHNLPALATWASVYALDMPGNGYTQPLVADPRYDLPTLAKTLATFLDRLGLERVVLVGNSWGGGWALYFAQQHPERVRKLVLIDSSGLVVRDKLEWELLKYPLVGELLSKAITSATVRQGLRAAFADPAHVDQAMVQEIKAPLSFWHNRRAQYQLARQLDWRLTEQALASTSVSTLVLWGDRDRYLAPQLAQRFAQQLPHARAVVLPNSGHVPHEEQPELVNQLLRRFAQQEPAQHD